VNDSPLIDWLINQIHDWRNYRSIRVGVCSPEVQKQVRDAEIRIDCYSQALAAARRTH